MSFHLLVQRDNYTLKSTTGKMFLNGEYFGYTLEDTSRGSNIKIAKHTCIPEGTYEVHLTMSTRFKREMPMVYNQGNGYELRAQGISFKGIRIHGGNRAENTEGCILLAKNYLNEDLIQGSLEKELTKELNRLGGSGWVTIINR